MIREAKQCFAWTFWKKGTAPDVLQSEGADWNGAWEITDEITAKEANQHDSDDEYY